MTESNDRTEQTETGTVKRNRITYRITVPTDTTYDVRRITDRITDYFKTYDVRFYVGSIRRSVRPNGFVYRTVNVFVTVSVPYGYDSVTDVIELTDVLIGFGLTDNVSEFDYVNVSTDRTYGTDE